MTQKVLFFSFEEFDPAVPHGWRDGANGNRAFVFQNPCKLPDFRAHMDSFFLTENFNYAVIALPPEGPEFGFFSQLIYLMGGKVKVLFCDCYDPEDVAVILEATETFQTETCGCYPELAQMFRWFMQTGELEFPTTN